MSNNSSSTLIKFNVGKKFCLVNIQLLDKKNPNETLQRFLTEEDIPVYLHMPLSSFIHALAEEDRRSQCQEAEAVTSQVQCVEEARLLARTFTTNTVKWGKPPKSFPQDTGIAQISFADAYHVLCGHVETRKMLLQLERQYALAIHTLLETRARALTALQDKQQTEMQNIAQSRSEGVVQQLVNKHVGEMQALEQKWDREIKEAKELQKEEYQNFIIETYKNSNKQELNRLIAAQRKTPKVPQFGSGKQEDGISAERVETFTVYLGSQLKTLYNIKLATGDILRLCGKKTLSTQTKNYIKHTKLYSSELSAVILLTDVDVSFSSQTNREFLDICRRSTEFHFEDVEIQLAKMNIELGNQKLNSGDFFVTQHSNLAHVHVVFHIAIEKKNDAKTLNDLVLGLKNILDISSQYDIATLSLPVFFIDPSIKHLFSANHFKRRADTIIKTIRQFLMENTRSEIPLRTIQLIHPPFSEYFEDVREMLKLTFHKTMA